MSLTKDERAALLALLDELAEDNQIDAEGDTITGQTPERIELWLGKARRCRQAIAALTRDALPPGIEASEYRAKCLDADVGLESCRRSVFDDTLADLERHLIANRWTRHAAGWRCPYCENWRNR